MEKNWYEVRWLYAGKKRNACFKYEENKWDEARGRMTAFYSEMAPLRNAGLIKNLEALIVREEPLEWVDCCYGGRERHDEEGYEQV